MDCPTPPRWSATQAHPIKPPASHQSNHLCLINSDGFEHIHFQVYMKFFFPLHLFVLLTWGTFHLSFFTCFYLLCLLLCLKTQIQIVENYFAKNVILVRALVCPSHMPGQYTVQTQIVVGVLYQEKAPGKFYFRHWPAHVQSFELEDPPALLCGNLWNNRLIKMTYQLPAYTLLPPTTLLPGVPWDETTLGPCLPNGNITPRPPSLPIWFSPFSGVSWPQVTPLFTEPCYPA